jgi:undecaprenyl-diphosphatase
VDLWFAGLMGLVQGLTEFLPISSTAHLRITPTLLGQPDPGTAYTAVIQLGTLLAVVAFFARDLFVTLPRAMLRAPRSPEGTLPWKLALGTLPIVVVGVLLKDHIEGGFRSLYVVAAALAVVGLAMAWVDRRDAGTRGGYELGWLEVTLVGVAQALAVVPGVSRSGATICAALLLGTSRSEAARLSFLLGIPAIAGAGVFELDTALADLGSDAALPLLVGTGAAAVSGYAAIAWLLRFLGTRRLRPFAVYRLALAALLLALLAAGVIAADAGA